jgi:hypothetical protein
VEMKALNRKRAFLKRLRIYLQSNKLRKQGFP